jgi:hypothetical protein
MRASAPSSGFPVEVPLGYTLEPLRQTGCQSSSSRFSFDAYPSATRTRAMAHPPRKPNILDTIDPNRIDGATLALLLLGRHDGARVWKSFDWDVLYRLHEKGLISNPRTPDKSVVLTEDGEQLALLHFKMLFSRDDDD